MPPVRIPSDFDSGITGIVLVGPQCRVIGPNTGPEWEAKPPAATAVVKTAGGLRVVTRFTSHANGEFGQPGYPGHELLAPQPVSPGAFPIGTPQSVQVEAGEFTNATIHYDTGIR